MRSRAASISGSVGRSNVEHLLEDLTNGRERVEPARLDVVEQPPQLRVVPDRRLEMPPRTRRGDLEHLLRQVRPPPPLQLSVDLEPGPMLGDLLLELLEPFAAHRLGEHDRRAPAFGPAER